MSARNGALLAALVALVPAAARGSAADAFENKVKPVSGQLYTKAGKLELTLPSGIVSFNDAFFNKYMAGAKVTYHLSEYFSVGVTGAYGTTSTTGSTSICNQQGCRSATQVELDQVPGEIKWMVGAEVGFSPIYGKLNVFAEKALHFDLFILGGADLVTYRDVLTGQQARPPPGGQGLTAGNVTQPGGHVGLGARIFFARFMALRLEVRDVLYQVPALATGKLQNQLLAEAGLSFFLGRSDAP
jgi:outer membrane beta-barrel protein